ncbi:NB-ARC domain containing protein, partial [Trema orientale]
MVEVAKGIITAIRGGYDYHGSDNLSYLEKCIANSLFGKTFLLVLDDVWDEDYVKWVKLKGSLELGAIGSRIVVTTQKERVADVIMMRAPKTTTIRLELLSEEHC